MSSKPRNLVLERKLKNLFSSTATDIIKQEAKPRTSSKSPQVSARISTKNNNNNNAAESNTKKESVVRTVVGKRKIEEGDQSSIKKQKQETEEVLSRSTQLKQTSSFTKLQDQMKEKLEGARFRWLNEQLYTTPSSASTVMFDQEPELFDLVSKVLQLFCNSHQYHKGFRRQVAKWPTNPVDVFVSYIKSKSPKLVIGDFGCGEAKIAQSVPNTVHSFDLFSPNKFVTKCDISHV
jgi:hypothetical protein